jgi:hypothetical protein
MITKAKTPTDHRLARPHHALLSLKAHAYSRMQEREFASLCRLPYSAPSVSTAGRLTTEQA